MLTQVEKVLKESIEEAPKLNELREAIKECLKVLRGHGLNRQEHDRTPSVASLKAVTDSYAVLLTALRGIEASIA